jgi:hypothetical protein
MGGPWAKQKKTGERVTANVHRARIGGQRSHAGDDWTNSLAVIDALALAGIHAS